MASVPRFREELALCPGSTFTGKCFRVVDLETFLKNETPTLLFDLGPKIEKGGQRFSPPGDHRGLYVSAEAATAGAEFADGLKNWDLGRCSKHVTFDMDVCLASALDLTNPSVRRTLHTSKREIQSAWMGGRALNGGIQPPTWSLGHEAFASGRFDGILFPSTKNPNGACLLIFTERLLSGRTHVIIHKQNGTVWERLP